jgi:hypothetical protein
MPRMTPQEAGRKGGLIGGRSRSPAKLAAARRNGFQRTEPTPAERSNDASIQPASSPLELINHLEEG